MMTFKKYIRLLLVAAFPLLLIGSILAHFYSPFSKYTYIFCKEPQYCSTASSDDFWGLFGEGSEDNVDAFLSPARKFDRPDAKIIVVSIPESPFNIGNYTIAATGRGIGATLASFNNNPNFPEGFATEAMKWVGMSGAVALGVDGETNRTPTNFLLATRELKILDYEGLYEVPFSLPDFPGWRGHFKFSIPREDFDQFSTLIGSIEARVRKEEIDRIAYIIIAYPSLLYLFLIASMIVWLVKRAKAYVDAA